MKTIRTKLNEILLTALLIAFLVIGNANANGTELSVASSLENTVETKLEVEEWMISGHHWEVFEEIYIEEASDPVFKVEAWMIDENNWFYNNSTCFAPEAEEPLKIEKWMINENYWN